MRRALRHPQGRAARARIGRYFARGRSDRASDQKQRRTGEHRVSDSKPRNLGIAPEGPRCRGEEALHDSIFEGVEADHRKTSARIEKAHGARQRQREFLEFPIDVNPESLEGPRGRILTPITPRARADGFGHDPRQLPRPDDGRERASRNNCSCNRVSKPFVTLVAYHLRQFAHIGARQECGCRFAARRIHPHVERTIGAQRKPARGIIDLW